MNYNTCNSYFTEQTRRLFGTFTGDGIEEAFMEKSIHVRKQNPI